MIEQNIEKKKEQFADAVAIKKNIVLRKEKSCKSGTSSKIKTFI